MVRDVCVYGERKKEGGYGEDGMVKVYDNK